MSGDLCRPEVSEAGFPHRTPLVLAREENLLRVHLAEVAEALAGGGTGNVVVTSEPPDDDEVPEPSVGDLVALLDDVEGPGAVGAAFVAGRCTAGGDTGSTLADHLAAALDASAPGAPDARSALHAQAALSLALRGEPERAAAALRAVVASASGLDDALAAYHLAQLGDPSGYPRVHGLARHNLGHHRIMAARHLAGFLPFDGQEVDGVTVDVLGELTRLLDDDDVLVSQEIPGLLAEADRDAARPLLEQAAQGARHADTRTMAAAVLGQLPGG